MALSSMQKSILLSNPNAKMRVYFNGYEVAQGRLDAEMSEPPTQQELKIRTFANWFQNGNQESDWTKSVFQKIILKPEIEAIRFSLIAENNLLSSEEAGEIDATLQTAIDSIWNALAIARVTNV
jgi:hypothetical protein